VRKINSVDTNSNQDNETKTIFKDGRPMMIINHIFNVHRRAEHLLKSASFESIILSHPNFETAF
jgi:hypothetical protein